MKTRRIQHRIKNRGVAASLTTERSKMMGLDRILTTAVWAVATVGLVSAAARGRPTFSMDFLGATVTW